MIGGQCSLSTTWSIFADRWKVSNIWWTLRVMALKIGPDFSVNTLWTKSIIMKFHVQHPGLPSPGGRRQSSVRLSLLVPPRLGPCMMPDFGRHVIHAEKGTSSPFPDIHEGEETWTTRPRRNTHPLPLICWLQSLGLRELSFQKGHWGLEGPPDCRFVCPTVCSVSVLTYLPSPSSSSGLLPLVAVEDGRGCWFLISTWINGQLEVLK